MALAFLAMVGRILVLDGFDIHNAYLYAAMGFSLTAELLNIRARGKTLRHAKKHPQS
ncbi:MAG: hypothetical protein H7Z73_08025 [Candidatus Saccharibacteria bacterium]|nr:hypothetical protein [Moraxellaceae bacterium]